MMVLMFVTVGLLSLPMVVSGEASDPLPDEAALLKMRVKDLKAFLQKKGADAACVACTSKQEYVSRIHETADWPDVTSSPEATAMGDEPTMEDLQRMFSESQNDERIAGLKKQLEEAGIDTSKIFTAGGLNRDEVLKQKEQFEKMRDETNGEGGDDETKSDL